MQFFKSIALAVAALHFSIFTATAAHAQEMPPLSAYGELPSISDAAISPTGERVAALMTVNGTRLLVAFDSENNVIASNSVDGLKVRYFQWVGEDRLLLVYSLTEDLGYGFATDKHEFSVGLSIPVGTSEEGHAIFNDDRKIVNAIFSNYGVRQIDGRWYGFFGGIQLKKERRGGYVFNHGRPYLYQVDLQTNDTTRIAIAASEGNDNDWLVDENGEVAATYNINLSTGRWTIRNSENEKIAEGRNTNGRSGLIGLGKDGASVLYYETNEAGATRRYDVPLAGGTPEPFLPEVDVERLYFDRQTGYLTGYLEEGAGKKPILDDPAQADALTKVYYAFREYNMRVVDWNDDISNVMVRTTGDGDSGSWFTVDVENLRAQAFAYERDAIRPHQVGPVSTFEYVAADGLELDGILTLPPGREAANLPVVMLPHGGPHAYDEERFDWWAQAFASRGYAVFQPNFRGSTHKTGAFRRAGYGEWGRAMQTDISDGLSALAEAGIVDPERACIVGASYGGYAALAGVTIQQGIYQCAVAVAPVSDIRRMYREDYQASGETRVTRTALREQLGDPDLWNDVSPERHADRADAPIMLIHGKDDTVVPYVHSTKMADALDDEGKPYEMVTLEGEDHWLSLSETRLQMLTSALAFVQEHNPSD